MNDISIQYQGFRPSDFTRAFWDAKLSDLRREIPSGATIRAAFMRRGQTFTATVRVLSSAGDFFASARSPHMREASQQLAQRLRRQLKRWKNLRSRHRSLKNINIREEV